MKHYFEIATPSLVDYSLQLAQKTQEGWELDVDNVNTCPTFLGNLYVVTLVKEEGQAEEQEAVAQKPKRVPPQRKAVG